MTISTHGLVALVIFAICTPALALAERHDISKKELYDMTIPSLVFFITIAALVSIIGYAGWKLYKVRQKISPKIAT